MLTAVLSTLVLGTMLQDAPVAENDPKAVTLLQEFDARLYDPVDEGLKTLSFDMDMPNPMMGGSVGVLSVNWSKDGGAEASFELSEQMAAMIPENMRAQMDEQMQAQMGDAGTQIARVQTNRVIEEVLEDMFVTLDGAEEGLIKVTCKPKDGDGSGRTLFFDEEGSLSQMQEKAKGPMGQEVDQRSTMTWRAVSDDSDKLLLAGTEESAQGMSNTSNFTYEEMGGFHFVTKITTAAMGQEMAITFSNFVVNGERMGAAPAAEGEGEG